MTELMEESAGFLERKPAFGGVGCLSEIRDQVNDRVDGFVHLLLNTQASHPRASRLLEPSEKVGVQQADEFAGRSADLYDGREWGQSSFLLKVGECYQPFPVIFTASAGWRARPICHDTPEADQGA